LIARDIEALDAGMRRTCGSQKGNCSLHDWFRVNLQLTFEVKGMILLSGLPARDERLYLWQTLSDEAK
jgi:hypothetical protein